MSSQIIVMGMIFDEEDVPEFGSIYAVRLDQNGVNEYGLNEADAPKLNLITNAAMGSTALADDSGKLYRLTSNGWTVFGDGTVITLAAQNSISPGSVLLNDTAVVLEQTLNDAISPTVSEPSVQTEAGELSLD